MGNIYLYMRKNTTKKMKLKKIQLNKTKNNRQKKKGSVVRRMTMKKRGGTPLTTNPALALGILTPDQMGQVASLESIVAEDIERRGAFIIREIYHILRKNTMIGHKASTPIIMGLQTLFNSGSGAIFDKALDIRLQKNTDFLNYLKQMSSMMAASVAPAATNNVAKVEGEVPGGGR